MDTEWTVSNYTDGKLSEHTCQIVRLTNQIRKEKPHAYKITNMFIPNSIVSKDIGQLQKEEQKGKIQKQKQ